MKRFHFDLVGYIQWLAAITLSAICLLVWVLVPLCILDACSRLPAYAEEAPEAEAIEVIEEAEAPVLAEAPEVLPPVPEENKVDPELLEQLAIVVYREAGGDNVCDDCRTRVADVALNRVADDRFPDTLEGVLTQKNQYGAMHWDGIVWPDRADNPGEAHAVERAYAAAEDVLLGNHSELYGEGYIFQSEFPKLGEQPVECCGIYYAKG